MKTSKIGLNESLGFYNKKTPEGIGARYFALIGEENHDEYKEPGEKHLQNFFSHYNTSYHNLLGKKMPIFLFTIAISIMIIALFEIIYFMRVNKQLTENEFYRMLGGTASLFYFSYYDLLSPNMLSFISILIGLCFGAFLSLVTIIQITSNVKNNKKIKVFGWIISAIILLIITYFKWIEIIIIPVAIYLVYYFLASVIENKLNKIYPKTLKVLSHISIGLFIASIVALIYYYIMAVFA